MRSVQIGGKYHQNKGQIRYRTNGFCLVVFNIQKGRSLDTGFCTKILNLKAKGMGKDCCGFSSNDPSVLPATSRLSGLALAKLQAKATSCPDPNCWQSREDANVARKVPPSPWEIKPMLQEMFTLGFFLQTHGSVHSLSPSERLK